MNFWISSYDFGQNSWKFLLCLFQLPYLVCQFYLADRICEDQSMSEEIDTVHAHTHIHEYIHVSSCKHMHICMHTYCSNGNCQYFHHYIIHNSVLDAFLILTPFVWSFSPKSVLLWLFSKGSYTIWLLKYSHLEHLNETIWNTN